MLFVKLQLDVESSHHKTATFYYKGHAILRTRVSHGRGDIPPIIVAKMQLSLLKHPEFQPQLIAADDLLDRALVEKDFHALLSPAPEKRRVL